MRLQLKIRVLRRNPILPRRGRIFYEVHSFLEKLLGRKCQMHMARRRLMKLHVIDIAREFNAVIFQKLDSACGRIRNGDPIDHELDNQFANILYNIRIFESLAEK